MECCGLLYTNINCNSAFGLIARKIGVELFGLYTLAMIFIGYASIFDAGLTRAVVREIALLKTEWTIVIR